MYDNVKIQCVKEWKVKDGTKDNRHNKVHAKCKKMTHDISKQTEEKYFQGFFFKIIYFI